VLLDDHVCCLDLMGDSYTFGRGEICDYQFSTDCMRTNPCYQAYSKVHFKVTKVMHSVHSVFIASYNVYIAMIFRYDMFINCVIIVISRHTFFKIEPLSYIFCGVRLAGISCR